MQEALAAACIMATGWDKKRPLVVPFSGSGTPAIEAALMARNILPGMFRNDYAFMHLKGWTSVIPGEKAGVSARRRIGASPLEIWREMTAQAKLNEVPHDDETLPKIIGVDWEEDAVDISERNANAAGVGQNVKFFVDDFSDSQLPVQPGIIFMNPPYGERLEDETALEPLYDGVNEWLRNTVPQGWEAWMITSSKPLSLRVRLQTKQILEFKNGALDCRLLGYDIGKPLADLPPAEAENEANPDEKSIEAELSDN
jgi:putative N6-adenine-specific DNA methylase